MFPWNSTSEGLAHIWQSKWVGIIAIITKRALLNSRFKRRSRYRRIVGSYGPWFQKQPDPHTWITPSGTYFFSSSARYKAWNFYCDIFWRTYTFPEGPTPYPFIYHFWQKRSPFRIPCIENGSPFTNLVQNFAFLLAAAVNALSKPEVFLVFFTAIKSAC